MATENVDRGMLVEKVSKKNKTPRESSVPASERRLVKLETGLADLFDCIGECENIVETWKTKVHDNDKKVDAAECKVDAIQDKVDSLGEELSARLFQHVNTILEC
ncbi:unnamed protein product [Rhodiola kirilowii]